MARRRGFTLVELLVVVAIIALLLAILLPALAQARAVARSVVCQTSQKQIGTAWVTFATDNDDRGPGRGESPAHRQQEPYAWADWLNVSVFGAEFQANTDELRPIQKFIHGGDPGSPGPAPNTLSCPDMNRFTPMAAWCRPYMANAFMCGGPNYRPYNTSDSPDVGGKGWYGKVAPHPFDRSLWYMLGTVRSRVPNPAYLYNVFESGYSTDDVGFRGDATLTVIDRYPGMPYTFPSRYVGFRHPQLTGNFLMADGHVENISAHDPQVHIVQRYDFEPDADRPM